MIQEQTLPCPTCQTKIPFDPVALIRGHKFSCPNCQSVVGIANEEIENVSKIYQEYTKLKQKIAKKN